MVAKVGMVRKPKACTGCREIFNPTGNNAKFCQPCSELRLAWSHKVSMLARVTGAGSGGQNAGDVTIHNYRYRMLTRLYLNQRGMCSHCLDSYPESLLLVHHKDEDRHNNCITNLELVCKRCHQIEHECWLAFSKV